MKKLIIILICIGSLNLRAQNVRYNLPQSVGELWPKSDTTFYPGGSKIKVIHFLDSLGKVRKFSSYYPNGNMQSVFTFNSEEKSDGISKTWYENGSLLVVSNCNNGLCCTNEFYENGNLKSSYLENDNGDVLGFLYVFHISGGIVAETVLDSSLNLCHREFYKSGKIHSELRMDSLNENKTKTKAVYKEYFENGKLKSTGFYSDIEIFGLQLSIDWEKRDGNWCFYNQDGKIYLEQIWRNGILAETMEYH